MQAGWTNFGTVAAQQRLYAPEGIGVDKRRLFAVMDFVFVAYFAGVENVGQEAIEAGLGEGPTAAWAAVAGLPLFAHPAAAGQLLHHRQECLVLQVQGEDGS